MLIRAISFLVWQSSCLTECCLYPFSLTRWTCHFMFLVSLFNLCNQSKFMYFNFYIWIHFILIFSMMILRFTLWLYRVVLLFMCIFLSLLLPRTQLVRYMWPPVCVCLSVYKISQKIIDRFEENMWNGRHSAKEEVIKLWDWSGFGSGCRINFFTLWNCEMRHISAYTNVQHWQKYSFSECLCLVNFVLTLFNSYKMWLSQKCFWWWLLHNLMSGLMMCSVKRRRIIYKLREN